MAVSNDTENTGTNSEVSTEVIVEVLPGALVRVPFESPQGVRFTQDAGSLLVAPIGGGEAILLQDFLTFGTTENPPKIEFANGQILEIDQITPLVENYSEADVSPASGDDFSAGGGANFSEYVDQGIGDPIDIADLLPPTDLAFGDDVIEEIIGENENFDGLPNDNPDGTITISYSTPGASGGSVSGGYEDWQPNQNVGDFSEAPMQVVVEFTPDSDEQLQTIDLSGFPDGARFFIGGTDAGDEVDVSSGSTTIATVGGVLPVMYILPPSNSDADITLGVTANFVNGDGFTGSTEASGTAVIDAVADIPELSGSDATGDEDTAIDIPITAALEDSDGSESLAVSISGVPVGATLSDGVNIFVGDGTDVDVSGWNLGALQITPPTDDDSDINLTVTAVSTEAATVAAGGELTDSNNTATTSITIDVTVDPVSDIPTVVVSDAAGKEDLGNAGDQIASIPAPAAGDIPLNITLTTGEGGTETGFVILSGYPAGVTFNVGSLNGLGWLVEQADLANLAIDGLPEDSDADFSITVTPWSQELPADPVAGTPGVLNVVIDAVADIPTLTLDGSAADAATSGDEDTAIDLPDITFGTQDADGSETATVSISGVPVGAALSDGVNSFVGDGSDVDVTGWDLTALTITSATDDDTDFTLTVSVTSTEGATVAGGGEINEADNSATVSYDIDVTVDPASDIPTVVVSDAAGKEDLGNAGDQIASIPAPAAGDIPLNITLTTGEGGTEDGYVILSGYPFGISFNVGSPDVTGWRVEQADLVNLAINGLQVDSDADFSITVTPWSQDGSADPVAGTPGVLNVVIDAVADIPTLTLDGSAADATATGDEDTAIDLPDITFGTQDVDGSETATVSISGVPVGAALSDGVNSFAGDGSDVDVTGWDLTALTITSATDDDTDFTLTVSVTSTEGATVAGGGEINEADNSATVSYDIDVTVDPVSDIPTVVVSDAAGKEDLGSAGDQIASIPAPAAGDIPLNITLTTGEGGTETGFVILSGYPAGVTFNVGSLNGLGWLVEQADLANLAIDGLPEDSDADFSITVTPWSQELPADPVAGTPGVLNVVIDAVADIPTLTLDGSAADAATSGDEDTAIDLPDIVFGTQDADGSETATVSISGVPVGAALSDGVNSFVGDGSDVDVTGWDLTALTITSATDDDTDFTLTVSVTSTEGATVAGGGEINEADNSATVSYDIDVTVDPASDIPTVVVSDAAGKEDLGNAGDQIASIPAPAAGDIPLNITLTTGEGGTEDGYVILSGYPFGISFNVGSPDVTGWRVEQADLVNLAINGLQVDSDADFSITVTPWSQDGSADPVAGTPGVLNVVIDAVADIPTLTLDGSAADATATGDEDTAIDLPDITFGTQDVDGSETATVSISGVPVGAALSDGVNSFAGDGSDVDVTGWDLTALTITSATDDDTDFTLTVSVTSTEGATVAGGGEINEADNSATVSYDIDVTVDPVSDIPTVVVSDAAGKEDLGSAGDQIASIPAPAAGDIPLNITLTTGEGGTETGFVILSGYPAGVTFNVGSLNGLGWLVEQADLANLAIDGLPEDSDADFSITVTPWSQELPADPVAGTPGVLNVVIDAVADIPTLTLDGSAADAATSGDEDTAIDLPDIVFGTQDADGSETATVSISGVPVGAALSDGVNSFVGDGSDVDVTGWDLTALTITSATDDDTDFTLTVSVTSTEGATVAGGGEINEADNSATVSYDIDVTVTDEGPVAVADNPPSLNEIPNTHAIFVIDTSGSLSATELAQMEAALKNLATTMFEANPEGTVITLIDFGTNAEFIGGGDGTYDTLDSVLTALDPLNTLSGGLTNYQAALDLARTVDFEPGFEKAVYFISDGDPNRGDTTAGIADFNDWVENDLGGADLYAVGITDVGETSPWLGSLDNTPTDNNVNPVGGPYLYVEDPSDLSASLITSNTTLSDNVLANDSAGNDALADVPIVSVVHNGTTYDLTSVGPNVSVDGNVLTLDTDLGRLVLNFENGDYTYSVTSDVNNVETDVFTYTIIDTDGLTSSADLTIQINPDSNFVGTDAAEDIVGGMTNDYIAGMGEDDTLNGGEGDDRFAFLNAATDGNDVIEDFGTGNDVIDLTAVFDELGIDPGDRADHVLFDESGGNTTITVTDASDVEVGGFSIVVENTSLNNGDIGTAIQVDES